MSAGVSEGVLLLPRQTHIPAAVAGIDRPPCLSLIMQDVAEAEGQVAPALLQRLILKPQKIQQLADGIRAIAAQEEPIRRVLQRMEVADG